MLINNGRGNEFRNYGHICSCLGEDADRFVAAAGHYGNKSSQLVKHYAEDLGYEYITASSKEEFLQQAGRFLNPEIGDKPIIFEVFTESQDESESIKIMRTFLTGSKTIIKQKIEGTIRTVLGRGGVESLKRILGRY